MPVDFAVKLYKLGLGLGLVDPTILMVLFIPIDPSILLTCPRILISHVCYVYGILYFIIMEHKIHGIGHYMVGLY